MNQSARAAIRYLLIGTILALVFAGLMRFVFGAAFPIASPLFLGAVGLAAAMTWVFDRVIERVLKSRGPLA